MKQIYRGASGVVTWLGPKTQDTTLAFQFIKDVAAVTRKRTDDGAEDGLSSFWDSIREDQHRYSAGQ